jgi:hypothetical protein
MPFKSLFYKTNFYFFNLKLVFCCLNKRKSVRIMDFINQTIDMIVLLLSDPFVLLSIITGGCGFLFSRFGYKYSNLIQIIFGAVMLTISVSFLVTSDSWSMFEGIWNSIYIYFAL